MLYHRDCCCIPLLSGGDKETDGVIFSSNLAVLFDNDVDEPDVDEDSLSVTVNSKPVKNELVFFYFLPFFITHKGFSLFNFKLKIYLRYLDGLAMKCLEDETMLLKL